MRICIVTDDIIGPVRNGGIGTAYANLATFLKDEGHDITILYTLGGHCEAGNIQEWAIHYDKLGIKLMPSLARPDMIEPQGPFHMVKAYRAYTMLRDEELAGRSFDVIHYHDWCAPGYFIARAKHQGLYFQKSRLVCGSHAPDKWARAGAEQLTASTDNLELYWMERESVRLADVVVSPSNYMFEWYREHGYTVEGTRIVVQNLLKEEQILLPIDIPGLEQLEEIVFFGRLEKRKGLDILCDALDKLVDVGEFKFRGKITFMGKDGNISGHKGTEYIGARMTKWPWKVQIHTAFDRDAAIEYLRQRGRLAVIASTTENSPYTVLECLGAGIPFVANDVGGVAELIHVDDLQSTLFDKGTLSTVLLEAYRDGIAPARMAVSQDTVRMVWSDLHKTWAETTVPAPIKFPVEPFISVILLTRNRPNYLRQAVESIRAQTYENFEVILFDSGSDMPGHLKFLDSIEQELTEGKYDNRQRRWTIVRHPHRLWPDAARNEARKHATGSYLFFMDDDNVAMPNEIETMANIANTTSCHVVSCAMDVFKGDDPPTIANILGRWIALGGCTSAGAWRNIFGDTNSLWEIELFDSLGGFTEHEGVGHEDWELYSKAALAGAKIEACPDPLFWYRDNGNGVNKTTNDYLNHRRNFMPYREQIVEAFGAHGEDLADYIHHIKYFADSMAIGMRKMQANRRPGP